MQIGNLNYFGYDKMMMDQDLPKSLWRGQSLTLLTALSHSSKYI